MSKKGSPGGLLLVMVMVVGERKSCPDRRARMAPFPAATPRQGRQTNAAKCRLTHSLRNYNYRVPSPERLRRGFLVRTLRVGVCALWNDRYSIPFVLLQGLWNFF